MSKSKVLFAALLVLCVATLAIAGTVTGSKNFTGEVNIENVFKKAGVEVTATAAELNKMDGVTATTAEINRAADVSASQSTIAVDSAFDTNTLSASVGVYVLTSSGKPTTETNTLVIATPYPVGCEWTFAMDATSSNMVTIVHVPTTMSLGSSAVLNTNDTISILAIATNVMVKTSGPNSN